MWDGASVEGIVGLATIVACKNKKERLNEKICKPYAGKTHCLCSLFFPNSIESERERPQVVSEPEIEPDPWQDHAS
jgi:hypothetical protein